MGYGWLKCNRHLWAGGSGGGGAGYTYGWPSGGTAESDVTAQWLFDEASGNIVAEVGSITLTQVGTPVYEVAATGAFAGVPPGIECTAGDGFTKAGQETALDPGTGNFVIEMWWSGKTGSNTTGFIFDTRAAAADNRGWTVYTQGHVSGNLTFLGRTTDNTQIFNSINTGVNFADDVPRKIRYVGNRAGSLELFIDGTSYGTQSLATWSGKAVETHNAAAGCRLDGAVPMLGTLFEFRFSKNATNNSGP